jgi:outer membrane receptor protein involved in Fe transport
MRVLLLATTAVAFAITGTVAKAQDSTAEEAGQSANTENNEIIVTARLRQESSLEVPLAVTVTSGEQLNRDQVYTLTDLQRVTPALQVNQGFGGDINGGAGLRGIRTQAFNPSVSPSVAIVLDQAAAGNVNFPILHDIASVEVLRGPQGTLFGQGASAGVLNVSTVAPKIGEFAANFNLDYADDGTAGSESTQIVARGGLTFSLGEKAAVRLAGFYKQEVGLRTNTFLNLDDERNEYAIRGRLLFEPTETITIHLIGDYAETTEDGVNFFSVTVAPTSTVRFGPPGQTLGGLSQANLNACGLTPDRINQRGRFYCEDVQSQEDRSILSTTAIVEAELSDNLSLTSVTSYRDLTVNEISRNFSSRAIGFAAREENTTQSYQQFSQELRLGYQGDGFDIVAGGYFADFNYAQSPIDTNRPFGDVRAGFRNGFSVCQPNGPCTLNPVSTPERADNRTFALFADATIELTDALELFGGLRFTDYRNENGSGANTLEPTRFESLEETNLSGRIGLSFQPNPDTNIYGSVSRGYKPSALTFPGNPTAPFIRLDAEENTAFELGGKFDLGRVQLDVNAFYMNVANFQGQESVLIAGQLVSQARNIGDVESYGIEVSATGQVTDNLSLNVGYTFNPVTYPDSFTGDDGSNLGGNQVLSSPRHKAVLSGEYVQPVSDKLEAFLNTNIVYRSETLLANRDPSRFTFPAGETVNLSLGVRHPDGNWTISVFARNLTKNREPIGFLPLNFAGQDDLGLRGWPIAGLTTRLIGASIGFDF